jgi:hypothetical protein
MNKPGLDVAEPARRLPTYLNLGLPWGTGAALRGGSLSAAARES